MSQRRTRRALVGAVLVTAVMTVLGLTGCATGSVFPRPSGATANDPLPPPPTLILGSAATPTIAPTLPALVPLAAPTSSFPVGSRTIQLTNVDRPLRTLVLFPAELKPDATFGVAPGGPFPLVLFSHGLRGAPELYANALAPIAAAGFIVALPTYPHTSLSTDAYDPADMINQPADASYVIDALLSLASQPDDPFFGTIDRDRIAAAGHSAGGYTTTGLLTYARDTRIRSAVVIAGATLDARFQGPAASVLFVHGDADETVPYLYGQATYAQVPWPKAFLTVLGGDHTGYLTPGAPTSGIVTTTVLEFLRATLYGDATALDRLPAPGPVGEDATFESTLVPTPTPDGLTSTATPTVTPEPEPSDTPSP